MVTRLQRAQLHLFTTEGESVTSLSLKLGGRTNEFLTVESVAFLFGFTVDSMMDFCVASGIKVYQDGGMKWLNCADLMPLFGWTPSVKGDIVD